MTTVNDTGQIPAVQSTPAVASHSHGVANLGVVGLSLVILLGVVLGFAGGIASHAMFPAHNGAAGAIGKTGKAGAAGPAGPIGATGSAANVSATIAQLGVCVNVNYATEGDWLTGVSVTTPTVTNGTQSCPVGTFTPVEAAPAPAPTQ